MGNVPDHIPEERIRQGKQEKSGRVSGKISRRAGE